jgi:hypothetical protein
MDIEAKRRRHREVMKRIRIAERRLNLPIEQDTAFQRLMVDRDRKFPYPLITMFDLIEDQKKYLGVEHMR